MTSRHYHLSPPACKHRHPRLMETFLIAALIFVSFIPLTAFVAFPFGNDFAQAYVASPAEIREAQDGLKKLKYYNGKSSGKLDRATQVAIQKFERYYRIKPTTGTINPKTLTALRNQLKKLEKQILLSKRTLTNGVLPVHPTLCAPSHGFDGYRTDETLIINPKNNQEMYVNIEFKGLYKSSDGGNSWKFSGNGIEAWPRADNPTKPCYMEYMSAYIDPNNTDRVFLVGGAAPGKVSEPMYQPGGLHESLDGGKSWHQLLAGNMNAYTLAMVTDPTDSNTIYVTTAALPSSSAPEHRSTIFVTKGLVYKSTDGGKNWHELPTGFVPHARATRLLINSNNSKHLMIGVTAIPPNQGGGEIQANQMGIMETKDGGATWETVTGVPDDFRAIRLFDTSADFSHLFIYGQKSQAGEDKVLFSQDGGLTFAEVPRPVNFARFDPHDPTGQHLAGFNLFAQPNDFFESFDGGKTWNVVGQLPAEVSNENRVSNIVWDPTDKNSLFLSGGLGMVWKSTDRGATWENILNLDKIK